MSSQIKPINLAGISTKIDPLPKDEYELVFVDSEVKEIQNGQNAGLPLVALRFQPYKEFHPEFANRSVFDNIPVIPPDEKANPPSRGTFWRLKLFGEAIGMSEEELANFDISALGKHKGSRLRARIDIEADRDDPETLRNKIKRYKPSTGLAAGIEAPSAKGGKRF